MHDFVNVLLFFIPSIIFPEISIFDFWKPQSKKRVE